MKKIFLLLSAISGLTLQSFAQTENTTPPPPPPPPPITADPTPPPAVPAPATTTTTTTTYPAAPPAATPPPVAAPPPATTVTTYSAPAAPAYGPRERGHIDVRRLRLGILIAPNISWMHPTAATDDKNEFNVKSNGSKVGFTYGLMIDYNFTGNYAIATGIQINTTGGKIIAERRTTLGNSMVKKADFDYRLNFLEVPLGLKLRTYEYSGFRFFGLLGITAGINIGKKATYTVNYTDENGAAQTATGSNIKLTGGITNIAPVLFQMNIGAGTEYLINDRMTAYFGLFFNNGFAPDATNPENFDNAKLGYVGDFRDANTRLNNFALRIGLFF